MELRASRCCFKNNLPKHRIAASPSLSNSTQAQLCLPSSCSRPLTFSSQAWAKQEGKEALFISCREAGSSKPLLIWNDSTYRSLILQEKSGVRGSNVQNSTNNCYHCMCSIVHIEAVHTCQVTTRSRGSLHVWGPWVHFYTTKQRGKEAKEEERERGKSQAGGTSS